MRFIFSKKRRPNLRVSSFRSQYQASVSIMPCAVFRPRLWTSVMNTSRPARLWFLVRPNSFAALIALMVSPPALARPMICAFEACAWSMYEEKSEAFSGWST